MNFQKYRQLLELSSIGKVLPDAVYLHVSLMPRLPDALQDFIRNSVEEYVGSTKWNLLKLHRRDFRISLLDYPGFDEDSYPALKSALTIDLLREKARRADYSKSNNPPILHRKESMVGEDYPLFDVFQGITKEGEVLGLYEQSTKIGFRNQWLRRIDSIGYELSGGRLQPKKSQSSTAAEHLGSVEIHRHRTAIDRDRLSTPMQCLSRYGFLAGDHTVLDYGCGKGDDVRELEAHGLDVAAWDPEFRPEADRPRSDVVNLGFVINVIESIEERREVLRQAFSLARKVLVVSAMTAGPSTTEKYKPYLDGVITSRNTFQKYYTQSELSNFIESSLQRSPVAVKPGVFFIFSDELEEQKFLSTKQRIVRTWKQLTTRDRATEPQDHQKLVLDNLALVEDFWTTCLDYGRILANDEYDRTLEIRRLFGSHKRAFEACLERFGEDELKAARFGRVEDITVYLALSFFGRRTAYTKMPKSLQRDIKAFFGSASAAQEFAQQSLFSVANTDLITQACFEARERLDSGHLQEDGAYVFQSKLLDRLPCVLRIYVGCASQLFGDLEDVDLIKIHMTSGKVSLMIYDDFNKRLPVLKERIKIRLRDQEIDWFYYGDQFEPQPLYLKSLYLSDDEPEFDVQEEFDRIVSRLPGFDSADYGPSLDEFKALWTHSNRSLAELGL